MSDGTSRLVKYDSKPPLPEGLVFVQYFNKEFGQPHTSGTISQDAVSYDTSVPLDIADGAPVWNNGIGSQIVYSSDPILDVCESNEFTIEFFCKKIADGTSSSAPTVGFQAPPNNYWHCNAAPFYSGNYVYFWVNDDSTTISTGVTLTDWNHFEIDVNGNSASLYINGVFKDSKTVQSIRTWFTIFDQYTNRAQLLLSQVALWNYCRHSSNFTVSRDPIYYL